MSARRPDHTRRALLGRALAAAGVAAGASAAPAALARPATRTAPAASAAADDTLLPAPLRALIVASGLPLHSIGLQIQPVTPGAQPLAMLNPERHYQLASTAKVVTTLAALDLLGADWRWRTDACLSGTLAEGVLRGNLVIVGGGDALLSSTELRDWFARMRNYGLNEVAGDIVLDRQAFRLDPRALASTPPPAPDRPHHAWPDPLLVDVATLREAGGPAVTPDQLTRQAMRAQWLAAGGRLRGRVVDAPVSPSPGAAPTPSTVAPGTAADAGPEALRREPWQVHYGPPLSQVLQDINKQSDNLAARNLMLSLAWGFPRQPATIADARARVTYWLVRQGLDRGDVAVDSGCGLSRSERGRPRAMVHLLRHAWGRPQARPFVDSLPVAGVDGTLQHRLTRGAATGNAFLKTGTLLDTRALAGYVRGRSGTVYALAMMANHPEAQRAVPAMDGIVDWVAARA